MAKDKTAFVCNSCGYDSPKWIGRCPSCGEWNTFVEVRLGKGGDTKSQAFGKITDRNNGNGPILINNIKSEEEPSMQSNLV